MRAAIAKPAGIGVDVEAERHGTSHKPSLVMGSGCDAGPPAGKQVLYHLGLAASAHCGRSAPGTRMPSAEHVNAGDQPLTQPLAREGGSTAVWTMKTHAWLGPVLDQPGTGRSQPEPAARRPRVVRDTGFCRQCHHLDDPGLGLQPERLARPDLGDLAGSQAVGPGPIGKRLAYCCSSWGMRLM